MDELDEQDRAREEAQTLAPPEEHVPNGKATWLTPLSGPWEAKFGEHTFHFPKWGKQLQPFQALLKGRPPDEVAQRFTRYLEQFKARDAHFASPAKFCETYDTWVEAAEDYQPPANGVHPRRGTLMQRNIQHAIDAASLPPLPGDG